MSTFDDPDVDGFPTPHWLTDDQAIYPLLRIARGERSTLTVEAARAMLSDWGDLLAMVGEFAMKAQRAERRADLHRERAERAGLTNIEGGPNGLQRET